jgi:transglutaminase-like putative cysteine protease
MRRMVSLVMAGMAVAAVAAGGVSRPSAAADVQQERFEARHEALVKGIPAGAKKARIWLVVPREDAAQRVGEIRLSGPAGGRVVRGGTYDNRYAYFEVENPGPEVRVAAEFSVRRREVVTHPRPEVVRPLTEDERRAFRMELEPNKYVPTGGKFEELAKQIVGDEKNPVLQARKLYDWVLEYVEYWVKDPATKKASPNGESEYCLSSRTGNCTDFHSLYASLSRSLGIPTRLVYGSFFQGENTPIPNKASLEGKDTDASYHCWIEFYTKGNGWTPLDVALADLLPAQEQQDRYFGFLDARRVTWSYGRDLTLAPKQDAGPVNAMHKVYVEIDGKPHTAWDRKFTYRAGAPAQ